MQSDMFSILNDFSFLQQNSKFNRFAKIYSQFRVIKNGMAWTSNMAINCIFAICSNPIHVGVPAAGRFYLMIIS